MDFRKFGNRTSACSQSNYFQWENEFYEQLVGNGVAMGNSVAIWLRVTTWRLLRKLHELKRKKKQPFDITEFPKHSSSIHPRIQFKMETLMEMNYHFTTFWWTGTIVAHFDITFTENRHTPTAIFTKILTTTHHNNEDFWKFSHLAPQASAQRNTYRKN